MYNIQLQQAYMQQQCLEFSIFYKSPYGVLIRVENLMTNDGDNICIFNDVIIIEQRSTTS